MIFGHGIDLQEISAVKKAYDRNPRFAKKVLTPKEWERFESLSGNRQMSYLAGRWAGKEGGRAVCQRTLLSQHFLLFQ